MEPRKLVSLALLLALAPGCYGNARGGGGGIGPLLFATGVVAGAVVASERADQERAEREREQDRSYGPSYQPVVYVDRYVAPPPDAVPAVPPPPPFDATQARNALAEIDLTKCRDEGAPRGYGHAKVTLNPSGDISKVVIDEPAGMPAGASKCVGAELGRARVPVFRGSLVTVGTTWFVP